MRYPLAAILLCALAVQDLPPREPGPFRAPDLVELQALDPTINLDIRYATTNNLAGRAVYTEALAFLQRPAAEALVRVHRSLKATGFGLVVFDAYRPWRITKLFWQVTRPSLHEFVADPAKGSTHNRGCAVDVSLYDLTSGDEVDMPSDYDEMSPRASPEYSGGSAQARARRDLLRAAMQHEGFAVEPSEWWHFNYKDGSEYPILDLPFGDIPPQPRDKGVR
jgi:zinc D-Ala-D-Ala dipeptidase